MPTRTRTVLIDANDEQVTVAIRSHRVGMPWVYTPAALTRLDRNAIVWRMVVMQRDEDPSVTCVAMQRTGGSRTRPTPVGQTVRGLSVGEIRRTLSLAQHSTIQLQLRMEGIATNVSRDDYVGLINSCGTVGQFCDQVQDILDPDTRDDDGGLAAFDNAFDGAAGDFRATPPAPPSPELLQSMAEVFMAISRWDARRIEDYFVRLGSSRRVYLRREFWESLTVIERSTLGVPVNDPHALNDIHYVLLEHEAIRRQLEDADDEVLRETLQDYAELAGGLAYEVTRGPPEPSFPLYPSGWQMPAGEYTEEREIHRNGLLVTQIRRRTAEGPWSPWQDTGTRFNEQEPVRAGRPEQTIQHRTVVRGDGMQIEQQRFSIATGGWSEWQDVRVFDGITGEGTVGGAGDIHITIDGLDPNDPRRVQMLTDSISAASVRATQSLRGFANTLRETQANTAEQLRNVMTIWTMTVRERPVQEMTMADGGLTVLSVNDRSGLPDAIMFMGGQLDPVPLIWVRRSSLGIVHWEVRAGEETEVDRWAGTHLSGVDPLMDEMRQQYSLTRRT